MKLTGKSLKNLIKEVLEEQRYEWSNSRDAAKKRFFELKPLVQAGQLEFEDEMNAAGRRMTQPDSVMSPEEQAAQAEKYPPEDHDAVKRSRPASKFKTKVPGPSGEVTIQGIPMMDREDDDRGLYPEGLMYEGDEAILEMFEDAMLEEGGLACPGCLFEMLQEASCGCPDLMGEAVYQGKTVQLNKPTSGDVKKFKVYVNSGKKDAKGRVKAKKINFGDKKMKIKKSNPKRRKSFRARHKCHTAKDKKTARYWSCKKW